MDTPTPPTATPSAPGAPPPVQQNTSTSTSSIVALILGILSLACCGFFTGIPAIFIGRAELKAVQEGRISESNRVLAKIGLILGIVGTTLSCLGIVFYILAMVLGISAGMMQDIK